MFSPWKHERDESRLKRLDQNNSGERRVQLNEFFFAGKNGATQVQKAEKRETLHDDQRIGGQTTSQENYREVVIKGAERAEDGDPLKVSCAAAGKSSVSRRAEGLTGITRASRAEVPRELFDMREEELSV